MMVVGLLSIGNDDIVMEKEGRGGRNVKKMCSGRMMRWCWFFDNNISDVVMIVMIGG